MVFEELSGFTKAVLRLIDDESYARLQYALADRPDTGPVIARSGGLRKMRWALAGSGKSGGVRVIYYWWVEGSGILLVDIFPKNEKENLSAAELSVVRKKLEEWKNEKDIK